VQVLYLCRVQSQWLSLSVTSILQSFVGSLLHRHTCDDTPHYGSDTRASSGTHAFLQWVYGTSEFRRCCLLQHNGLCQVWWQLSRPTLAETCLLACIQPADAGLSKGAAGRHHQEVLICWLCWCRQLAVRQWVTAHFQRLQQEPGIRCLVMSGTCLPCSPSAANSRLYCLGCHTLSIDSFSTVSWHWHCKVVLQQ